MTPFCSLYRFLLEESSPLQVIMIASSGNHDLSILIIETFYFSNQDFPFLVIKTFLLWKLIIIPPCWLILPMGPGPRPVIPLFKDPIHPFLNLFRLVMFRGRECLFSELWVSHKSLHFEAAQPPKNLGEVTLCIGGCCLSRLDICPELRWVKGWSCSNLIKHFIDPVHGYTRVWLERRISCRHDTSYRRSEVSAVSGPPLLEIFESSPTQTECSADDGFEASLSKQQSTNVHVRLCRCPQCHLP